MKKDKVNKYVLILAGGNGTRLWPISIERKPKQFLNLYGNEIMINETIQRVKKIFNYENIFIIVNEKQIELANKYIDVNIPRQNIISEPETKNTAICIFYATLKIKKMKGDGVITVLSSDHYIEGNDKLLQNIEDGIKLAINTNSLVTIGIQPSYPATGFGYIKYCTDFKNNWNTVIEFKEKPSYEMAVRYLQSNEYVWNSGMFIWQEQTILEEFKKYMANIYNERQKIYNAINTEDEKEVIKDIYNHIQPISIDKGILEKAYDIKMIKASFKWMDIGTIKDFFKIYPKDDLENTYIGESITKDVKKCNILNDSEELVVAIGIEDINIVKVNNACVVYNRKREDLLAEVLRTIKLNPKYNKYL